MGPELEVLNSDYDPDAFVLSRFHIQVICHLHHLMQIRVPLYLDLEPSSSGKMTLTIYLDLLLLLLLRVFSINKARA